MTQETPDEAYDRLTRQPITPHEQCPLCQDNLGRDPHALYLAYLIHAGGKNQVREDDPVMEADATRFLALPGKELHKRIFRELLKRTWK